MTARETRLRERIDQLTDERDQALALIPKVRERPRRTCVYCGALCRGWLTCRPHMDLPGLDPHYMALTVSTKAAA